MSILLNLADDALVTFVILLFILRLWKDDKENYIRIPFPDNYNVVMDFSRNIIPWVGTIAGLLWALIYLRILLYSGFNTFLLIPNSPKDIGAWVLLLVVVLVWAFKIKAHFEKDKNSHPNEFAENGQELIFYASIVYVAFYLFTLLLQAL